MKPNSTSPNWIAGSNSNSASAGVAGAAIGGGGFIFNGNSVSDNFATIGGGANNVAGNFAGTTTDAVYATVGGGLGNKARGSYSTVPGGRQNFADGDYSFAAGRRAQANHAGTFVWADTGDAILGTDFVSTAPNQFLIRASGGVGIGTNNPLGLLHLKGGNHKLLLESSGNADVVIGRADATRYGNFILADGNPSIGANNRWAIGLRNGDSKLHLYDEQNSLNVMVLEQGGKVGIGTSTPNSRLQVNGALATAVSAITVNSTLNESHSVVLASTPGVSDVVITLPTAVGIAGRQYTIKKTDAAAHTVVIDANGTETIDGASLYNLTTFNKYVTIVSNGFNWFVIANN